MTFKSFNMPAEQEILYSTFLKLQCNYFAKFVSHTKQRKIKRKNLIQCSSFGWD